MIDPQHPPDNGKPMLSVRPGDSPEIIELCYAMRRAQRKLEKMARRAGRYLAAKDAIEEERKLLRALQEAGDEAAKIRRMELYFEVLAAKRQALMVRIQIRAAQRRIYDMANQRARMRVGQPINPPRRPKGPPPPPPGPEPEPRPKVVHGFGGPPVVVIRRRR